MLSALEACTGRTMTGIRRVWYEVRGQVDQTAGALELTFDDGTTVVLDSGANGQSLRVTLGPWQDPFEGELSLENQQFVESSGKWSGFDVRHEAPYVDLIGERLTRVTPIFLKEVIPVLHGEDDVVGAIMRIGNHEVRAEVVADDLVVDIA